MTQNAFDDSSVRTAMRGYVDAAERLDAAAEVGGDARALLDAAEAKAVAGLQLRKALERQGWTAPARQGAPT